MDHRCLYGHRVPESFRYAIERDMCPVCGAELISVQGYKLARKLADAVPLDGVTAFKTARYLLRSFTLSPRQEAAEPDVPPGTEVQLDEEELAIPATSPTRQEVEEAEPAEPIAADLADEQPRNRPRTSGDTERLFSEAEDAFFTGSG